MHFIQELGIGAGRPLVLFRLSMLSTRGRAGVNRPGSLFSRLQPGVSQTGFFFVKHIGVKQRNHTLDYTPCWLDSQNPFSGDSSSIGTFFACLNSLAHAVGLGRVSASEVEGVRRNLYLPSSPTCTHPGAPPCTHRSVHFAFAVSTISRHCVNKI